MITCRNYAFDTKTYKEKHHARLKAVKAGTGEGGSGAAGGITVPEPNRAQLHGRPDLQRAVKGLQMMQYGHKLPKW